MAAGPGGVNEHDMMDQMDDEEVDGDVDVVETTRVEIEQTRAHMGDTINAIAEKLNPQVLMDQAKETVHDAVTEVRESVTEVIVTARENVPQMAAEAAHNAVHSAVGEAKAAVGSAVDATRTTISGYAQNVQSAGSSVVDLIRRNPIPAALIGTGLVWLYMSRRSGGREYSGYADYNGATSGGAMDTVRETAGDVAGRVGDAASNAADTVRDTAGNVAGTVRDAAGTAAGTVRDAAGNVAGTVRDTASAAAGRVRETTGAVVGRVRDATGAVVNTVQERAVDLGQAASAQATRASDAFSRTLVESPLVLGAAAIGIGAAVALMLPETRREHALMGETRDRLVDQARETAEELRLKAQIVAEEAIGTAKEQARDVAGRVVDATKQEAQSQGLMGGESSAGSSVGTGTPLRETTSTNAGADLGAANLEARDQGLLDDESNA